MMRTRLAILVTARTSSLGRKAVSDLGGKGTITHVMQALVGEGQHISRTMNDLGGTFGLEPVDDREDPVDDGVGRNELPRAVRTQEAAA